MEQCRQWSLLGAEGIRVAAVGNRRDGSLFPLELSMTQTDHLGLYVGLLRDVSERRALEQEVIEMSSQEQERIGREIHDGIGQQLTALSLFASSLQQNLQRIGREQEANSAKELTTYIQQVLQEAKNLSRGLAPLEIGREELPDILSMLAEQTQRSTEIDCRFDMPEWIGSLGESTALQLYRIAQEAVNNAVKHAKCRRIEIALQREAHHLVLSISDDGIGIDPEIHRIERLGMHIMRYRAGAVGGTLQVVSGAKGGTRIVCRVNLPASESNPEPRPEKQ